MNLNSYDNVIDKIDKTKTWIDTRKKVIISREIKFHKYTCLLKRYNSKYNTTSYYIAMLDNPPENKDYKYTICDSYGRIKIKVSTIWKETYLSQIKADCNINCELVESSDDGDVYLIDI